MPITQHLDSAAWELNRAMVEADAMAGDRNNTTWRRELAANQAAMLRAMLVLEAETRRLHSLMYVPDAAAAAALAIQAGQRSESGGAA